MSSIEEVRKVMAALPERQMQCAASRMVAAHKKIMRAAIRGTREVNIYPWEVEDSLCEKLFTARDCHPHNTLEGMKLNLVKQGYEVVHIYDEGDHYVKVKW